jgi:hypothetical protein
MPNDESNGSNEEIVRRELDFFFDENEGGSISLDNSKTGKRRVKNKVTCSKVAIEQLMKVGVASILVKICPHWNKI